MKSSSMHRVSAKHTAFGQVPVLLHRQRRSSSRPCVASSAPATSSPPKSTFHHGITYTSYEVNTFQVSFNTSKTRVLVDPWFVGDLTFGDTDWLYAGKKQVIGRSMKVDMEKVAAETDAVVLTQGLPDHTHLPTLKLFPKHVPIIANPMAAEIIKPLGFKDVRVLDHGQSIDINGKLRVTATVGALVGPPWSKRQNGLVFRELSSDSSDKPATSLYFESHCDYDAASVRAVGPVDVVISPVVTSLLGVGDVAYALVPGEDNLVDLLKLTRPKVLVPLLNSVIEHHGPLKGLISERGSANSAALRAKLTEAGLGDIRVEFPAPPGESMAIAL